MQQRGSRARSHWGRVLDLITCSRDCAQTITLGVACGIEVDPSFPETLRQHSIPHTPPPLPCHNTVSRRLIIFIPPFSPRQSSLRSRVRGHRCRTSTWTTRAPHVLIYLHHSHSIGRLPTLTPSEHFRAILIAVSLRINTLSCTTLSTIKAAHRTNTADLSTTQQLHSPQTIEPCRLREQKRQRFRDHTTLPRCHKKHQPEYVSLLYD